MRKQGIAAVLAVVMLLGVVGGAQAFFSFGKYQAVEAADGTVSIPVADVSDGNAHYFSYAHDGGEVKFFVIKSRDGVLRAAFDACDVCYRSQKGYSQDGDTMVCNNCGQKFHTTRINVVRGGCNPAPLEREVRGDDLIIAVEDILTGASYF